MTLTLCAAYHACHRSQVDKRHSRADITTFILDGSLQTFNHDVGAKPAAPLHDLPQWPAPLEC